MSQTKAQLIDAVDGSIVDADIVGLSSSKLSGTLADARFPATLPAVSGANLTNISAGKVLQTVNATATSQVERTSSGFADTGLTANITLTAANKVLIFIAQALEARQYNATGFSVGRLKLVRITSGVFHNVFGPGGRSIVTSGPGSGSWFIASGCIASIIAEDSPGAGTHTYATQIARTVGGGGTAVRANSDGHPAEIVLMEIEA